MIDQLDTPSLLALACAEKLGKGAKEELADRAVGAVAKEGGIIRLTYSWHAQRTADSADAVLPWSTPWRAIALHALARLAPAVADAAILAATLPGEAPAPSPAIEARLRERAETLAARGFRAGAVRGEAEILAIEETV